MGSDPTEFSTNNSIVYIDIFDGGFFEIQDPISAKYVTIRRPGTVPLTDYYYSSSEMLVYTMPNLLQKVGSKITQDTSPVVAGSSAENLI